MAEPRLAVDVGGGLTLRNPVIAAAGTFGYGIEFAGVMDLTAIGAIVVKGLSLEPHRGHPPPRILETAAGMLNAIGLQNVGVRAFIDEKLPQLREIGTPIVANCWGHAPEEFAEVAARLADADGLAAIEVNVSCPNKREWGRIIATDLDLTRQVVGAVRTRCRLPLWVKLSPNVTDIAAFARVVEEEGADAVSLVNTFVGLAVDLDTRRPVLTNVTGGLSGPAIKPIALRMVYEVARAVRIPVIGMGGIGDATDALEFLLVGARAVQVGTASFIDPRATERIAAGIATGLSRRGCTDVNQWIGTLQAPSRR
ncbi:MAG: dihydroorotate dehydrogenase B catalytic subunit [Polyangiaceae bacterium UTPRO1]|jgi:dihydroorotate dehydrogenase (NAD+) catalytic subunit|nr:dihydroorotate dehydrogenase [Myxococcales bacterium]OQY65664.1 MAG: dihydroorotate dehydrogenase B catalytic subunit [Polyangiaceae bacterium UTPRO1]